MAYAPFLMGMFPGHVGLPGLRWYDRSRGIGRLAGHARSYVGSGMRHVDGDLAPGTPTLYELTRRRLGALSVIHRGLPLRDRLGFGPGFALRAARTHFRGNVRGWLAIDRQIARDVAARIRRDRPDFVFAALTGIDKTSHAEGHGATVVHDAMRIVDDAVAEIRHDAERAGTWEETHLWVVSDHGHSPVAHHDDLALHWQQLGHRVLAHPWTIGSGQDVAVMVSGNAMAHIYVELQHRSRPFWPALRDRWNDKASALLARPSVDLMILPLGPNSAEVRAAGRGHAMLSRADRTGGFVYRPESGDPLGIGEVRAATPAEALDATLASDYPDAIVQILSLVESARGGDIILSAARQWDLRARYEPIPHFSSHGALHREHMMVPLLVNRPAARAPRRTADVGPSAVRALGLPEVPGLDGVAFL